MALKGIVIDPGHGGNDPGAVANNYKEKDINLKISKYMYDRLNELNIPVKLTRDSDITLSPSARVKKTKSFYGDSKDVIVISNHLNAGGGNGAEVIYSLRNNSTLSRKIIENFENSGFKVRKYFQLRLPSNSKKDYYFMLRDTANNESIIVEYGFIDNKENIDDVINNYKEYVEDVIKAICDYKRINYILPNDEIYIVKKGDSLWNIAKKYNTTVNKIKSNNNLKSDLLKIGQKLKIIQETNNKGVKNDYINYKVVKSDNLYSIANKYKTTINEIKTINNLTSDLIKPGQLLKIPK